MGYALAEMVIGWSLDERDGGIWRAGVSEWRDRGSWAEEIENKAKEYFGLCVLIAVEGHIQDHSSFRSCAHMLTFAPICFKRSVIPQPDRSPNLTSQLSRVYKLLGVTVLSLS